MNAFSLLVGITLSVFALLPAGPAVTTPDTSDCNMLVWYEDEELNLECPSVECDGDSGSCGAHAVYSPGGVTRYHCECEDGSFAECSTEMTISSSGSILLIDCLNRCAAFCVTLSSGPTETPQAMCSCDE